MALFQDIDQTIPENKKDKEWHMLHAMAIVDSLNTDSHALQKKDILKLFRGYNAELGKDEQQLAKAITCPNGTDLGVEYVVYPLIQTKIEQAVGEYMARPTNKKTYVIDKDSKSLKFQEKVKRITEEIMRDVTKSLQGQLGFEPETANKDIELPEDVEGDFEKNFKTIGEEISDTLLNIFLYARKERQKLYQIFTNYCVSDRAHAILEKKQGHTSMRGVHPLDATYDIDPYKNVQDDHDYFAENYYLSEVECYNLFRPDRETKKQIQAMFQSAFNSTTDSEALSSTKHYDGWSSTRNNINKIRVIHVKWKSQKTVKYKVNDDQYGNRHAKKLEDDYSPSKKETVKVITGEIPRFVISIGPDICLDYGVSEHRYSFMDAPWKCTLEVVSLIRDNTTGTTQIKSMAQKLYQMQEMASEILFEIRLAIKHFGDSRILLYDTSQTPKELVKDKENAINRVLTHIKKDKVMFINSKQKGSKSNFNQFTSLDLSQKGAVQDMFNALAMIESLASKFVGISPEREGQIGQYQTATGTDKAIRGSYARTEVFFKPFDDFVEAVLTKVILKAKNDYQEGHVLEYITGDFKTKFLKLLKEFFYSDYGMYLGDSRRDKEISEFIDNSAIQALSNANTPEMVKGLIDIIEKESAVEKKEVFDRVLKRMEERRAEEMKAAEEQQAQALEVEQAKIQKEDEQKEATLKNNIDVAHIYANNKAITNALENTSKERIKAAELAQKEREKEEV